MDHTMQRSKFLTGHRTDNWWIEPVLVLLGLSAFLAYATWAAFQGNHYYSISYLSPFYSPLIYIKSGVAGAAPLWHSLLGEWPSWWPGFLPASPALLILIFPGLFRFTCYYYRGAYYKAFAGSPPGCAIGVIPQKNYQGETWLLIFQNLHRYTMYIALLYIVILGVDAIAAFVHEGIIGLGVGSLILVLNPILLGLYTFGCHSFRHLVGGGKDCFSCSRSGAMQGIYKKVSWMNSNHKLFAWLSLCWVAFSDIYVRLVSMGLISDWNTWGV